MSFRNFLAVLPGSFNERLKQSYYGNL